MKTRQEIFDRQDKPDDLIPKLKKINDRIHNKIPVIANRHEEVEIYPLTMTLEEAKERYHEHEQKFEFERLKYNYYGIINKWFSEYHDVSSTDKATISSKSEREKVKEKLSEYINHHFSLALKVQDFNGSIDEDTEKMKEYLTTNLDKFATTLCDGKKLELEDKNLSERLQIYDKLMEERLLVTGNFFSVRQDLLHHIDDPSYKETLIKTGILGDAEFLESTHVKVGFCGEHLSLAIKYIVEQGLVSHNTMEYIYVEYQKDNHVFLAINRDPESKLEDIPNWGEKAIFFDPWNSLICRARDFNSQPVRYITYSDIVSWEVRVTFSDFDDYMLLGTVKNNRENFLLLGLDDTKNRTSTLIDEYSLISIDDEKLVRVKQYITEALKIVGHDRYVIQYFIMLNDPEPIKVIHGFDFPAIAIHRDYLLYLLEISKQGGDASDEFLFGLAYAIEYIRHFPLGNTKSITEIQSTALDVNVIKTHSNGASAINYARYAISFMKDHANIGTRQKISLSDYSHEDITVETYAGRIKNISTALVNMESCRNKGRLLPVDTAFESELTNLHETQYFEQGMQLYSDSVAKINYLTSMLPELRKELVPFEIGRKPGVRLKEFSRLLFEIKREEKEEKEVGAALTHLVNQAFDQQIPGFEWIYSHAIQQTLPPKWEEKASFSRIAPFSIFNELHRVIDVFVQATSKEIAVDAAIHLLKYKVHLKNHFYDDRSCVPYYAKKHLETLSAGEGISKDSKRFFGSIIGSRIAWPGFNKKDADQDEEKGLPWDKYFAWVCPEDDDVIPHALWWLGVVQDKRLLTAFSQKALRDYSVTRGKFEDSLEPLIELEGNLAKYGSEKRGVESAINSILNHLSATHHPDFTMYENDTLSFLEKFQLFYDRNLLALMLPTKERNSNNPTVRFLLKTFTQAALHGSPEDKKVVKDFFSEYKEGRNLHDLTRRLGRHPYMLPYSIDASLYQKFCLEQEFDGISFSLFTTDEMIEIQSRYFYEIAFDHKIFLKVCQIEEKEVTHGVLTRVLQILMPKQHWRMANGFIHHYFQSNSHCVLSQEYIDLLKLAISKNNFCRGNILHYANWTLPLSYQELHAISIHDIVFVYRAFDELLSFPSREKEREFGKLVLDKIIHINNRAEKMTALESLLFSNSTFKFALNSLDLTHQSLEEWIQCILVENGMDDGTDEYFEKLKVIINKVLAEASTRDHLFILTKLANKLLLQQKLSDYIGIRLEPEKYSEMDNTNPLNHGTATALSALTAITRTMSESADDRMAFLEYLTEPLTPESLKKFTQYLEKHKQLKDRISGIINGNSFLEKMNGEMLASHLYHLFWDRSVTERALMMNYLLIPSNKIMTAADAANAYQEAFSYVVKKLFKHAEDKNSDDNFAQDFLKSYLDTADEYARGCLLAGMVVTSNESHNTKSSTGKKLVLLCEHMGPAYVKLAQAIHSHPLTPPAIREDLQHIKGRANPPTRWQLWRMIDHTLSAEDKVNIKYVHKLLGSASYNIAVQVELKDNSKVVLSLLREHAEKDALNGFAHLTRAVMACQHPRILKSRHTILSLIVQAQKLSTIEMNPDLSAEQYRIARELYQHSVELDDLLVQVEPCRLLKKGKGYRFLEEAPGKEFNTLVEEEKAHPNLVAVAEAIVTIELHNLFRGGCFDSDRHGNQLRIEFDEHHSIIRAKLYDFGEMALTPPTDGERQQLANVIKSSLTTKAFFGKNSFAKTFEKELSNHIDMIEARGQSANYLMHIRKGMLALQDFYQHLSQSKMLQILNTVFHSKEIHPIFAAVLPNLNPIIYMMNMASCMTSCSFFTCARHPAVPSHAIKLISRREEATLVDEKDMPNAIIKKKHFASFNFGMGSIPVLGPESDNKTPYQVLP